MGALELARTIRSGQVSSREVVEAHLARIDEVNGDLNAIDEELMILAVAFMYNDDAGQDVNGIGSDFEARLAALLNNDRASGGLMSAGDIFGGRVFTGQPATSGIASINFM